MHKGGRARNKQKKRNAKLRLQLRRAALRALTRTTCDDGPSQRTRCPGHCRQSSCAPFHELLSLALASSRELSIVAYPVLSLFKKTAPALLRLYHASTATPRQPFESGRCACDNSVVSPRKSRIQAEAFYVTKSPGPPLTTLRSLHLLASELFFDVPPDGRAAPNVPHIEFPRAAVTFERGVGTQDVGQEQQDTCTLACKHPHGRCTRRR